MSQIAGKTRVTFRSLVRLLVPVCSVFLFMQGADALAQPPFLAGLNKITTLASTIPTIPGPGNGDVNPYGVAVVPVSKGALVKDNVLVSNFNNAANLQGTGRTIVQVSPSGNVTLFATIDALPTGSSCPGGIGLTTALVALRSGFVVVGSLPTIDGTPATAQAGCLIVLNSDGQVVTTLAGQGINGPWDMTALDKTTSAVLFVTNVLNGTVAANGAVVSQGSVLRIVVPTPSGGPFIPTSIEPIAKGFDERTDPNALVIGPTGLGLAADGTLFVADTVRSRIAAIPGAESFSGDAGNGLTVAEGGALKSPLGLAIAPNGDILTVNGGTALIVETTPNGRQANAHFIDISHSRNGAGTLFGLAVAPDGDGVYFVDDGNNTLNLLGDGQK